MANGLLNAPEYTRTCQCSYPNQTSLAMVHDPDVDMWVTYFRGPDKGPIRQVGINLGAPGNRRAPDGRFWIAHPLLPFVSNPQKESGLHVDVQVTHGPGGYYTRHTSRVSGAMDWVAASGCRGIKRLELDLQTVDRALCDLRLVFAEPDHDVSGRRVFDIWAEGEERVTGFDVAREAGGRWRAVETQITQVDVTDGHVTLEFIARGDVAASPETLPLLCGVSVTATYD